jgi:hypothetical protein
MSRIALTRSLLAARYPQQRAAAQAGLCASRLFAARFESTKSGATSTIKERQQYLQADWVAPKLTYEEVKKRTQEPTEVRLRFATRIMHQLVPRMPT